MDLLPAYEASLPAKKKKKERNKERTKEEENDSRSKHKETKCNAGANKTIYIVCADLCLLDLFFYIYIEEPPRKL